jgi:hypothetical protein
MNGSDIVGGGTSRSISAWAPVTAGESAGLARGTSSRRPHGTAQVQPRKGALESARTARIPPVECGRNCESVAPQTWQGQARRASAEHMAGPGVAARRCDPSDRAGTTTTTRLTRCRPCCRTARNVQRHALIAACNAQPESAQQAPERAHPRWALLYLSPRPRRGPDGQHQGDAPDAKHAALRLRQRHQRTLAIASRAGAPHTRLSGRAERRRPAWARRRIPVIIHFRQARSAGSRRRKHAAIPARQAAHAPALPVAKRAVCMQWLRVP